MNGLSSRLSAREVELQAASARMAETEQARKAAEEAELQYKLN